MTPRPKVQDWTLIVIRDQRDSGSELTEDFVCAKWKQASLAVIIEK